MVGGVARSFAELDNLSAAWWARMKPEERLECVFDMYDEQMRFKDPRREAASRLPRAVGGVRPRRG
jgi:hypothetical protein